jgi:long-chain acyl-CoA synthetase
MGEVRPTVMVCVPRLFEKIHARALEAAVARGALSRAIFHWAVATGGRAVRQRQAGRGVGAFHALAVRVADLLVFSKLRRRTGGRIRYFISGGAPLSVEIAEFFFAAGLPIIEGYGLTESSPVIAVNRPDRPRIGSVGPALPGVEIRIAEDGEILARGPNIMIGYYQRPEATGQALRDGWLHTGDIGHLDPEGYLHITDRKKDLIVTAGGKKVAPQPIENRLVSDRFINLAMVVGDRRPFLVALIVPDFQALERYARYKRVAYRDRADLLARPEIRDLIARRIGDAQEGSAPYETIKNFVLLPEELDIDHNQLTPTLKVKRRVVAEQFAAQIEALYAGADAAPAASVS